MTVAVVGGGWSGLAAAVELTDRGIPVTVFEAAPQWGGRARRATVRLGDSEIALDNGQHLMLGAYSSCLTQIMRVRDRAALGGDGAALPYLRSPLRIATSEGPLLARASLPGTAGIVAGLLGRSILTAVERWALVRLLAAMRWHNWRGFDGLTVAQLLARFGQPRELVERLWEPLCIAALNTEAAAACAQTFATVLRDSLGAGAGASDFITPRDNLGALFPEPAAGWLAARGARLRLRSAVNALNSIGADGDSWRIGTTNDAAGVANEEFAAVVLAVPPPNAARLLAAAAPVIAAELGRFEFETIATIYLGWRERQELAPVTMLAEDGSRAYYGQWLFDRGRHDGWHVAAAVVSAQGRRAALPADELASRVVLQVSEQLRVPQAQATRVVIEKRATWRCLPGRPLLTPDSCARQDPLLRGLWLAGDHACPERYPATLEGAVRSGLAAARGVAALLGTKDRAG